MKIKQAYSNIQIPWLKLLLSLWLGLVCGPGISQTGGVELTQVIEKNYSFSEGQILEIKNKYGKVHVNTWDKPQANIRILIVSKANSRANAQKRLDEVEIKEGTFGQKKQLQTIIPENGIIPSGALAKTILNRGVSISYEIYVSKEILLEIENRFGDVYLSDREANVDVEVNYGKIIAERLSGDNNSLKLSFGDSDIAYFGGGNMEYAFVQRLYIGEAEALSLNTNSTNAQIGQVGTLNFTGKLGKMDIHEVDRVSGGFSSTLFTIAQLNKSLNMNIKYAPGFQIAQVAPGFTSIRIESNFSPIQLNFSRRSTFLLDAQMEFGSINFPSLNKADVTESKNGNFNISEGIIGPESKAKSKVYIRGKYGNLKISQE